MERSVAKKLMTMIAFVNFENPKEMLVANHLKFGNNAFMISTPICLGYGIEAHDPKCIREMESTYGVRMTQDYTSFYQDNCHGADIARYSTTVPKDWVRYIKTPARKGESDGE